MRSFRRKANVLPVLMAVLALFLHGCSSPIRPNHLGFIDHSGKFVIDLDKYFDRSVDEVIDHIWHPFTPIKRSPHPEKVATNVGDFYGGMAEIRFNGVHESAGFINEKGKAVGAFEDVKQFSEGVGAVLQNIAVVGHWGYITAQGDFVLSPKYCYAKNFSQGLAAVCPNNKWGFIDARGKFLIEPTFDDAESFSDGLAAVRFNKRMGCINRAGKFVLQPIYDKVYSPSCGITVAENTINSDRKQACPLLAQRFYFEKNGKLLFDRETQPLALRYLAMEDFGLARKLSGGSLSVLGITGTPPPSFSEDLAVVQVGSKFGYMDKSGAIVIEPTFDYAFNFSEGRAIVYKDDAGGLFAYIDRTGKPVTSYKFKFAQPFSEGLAVVSEQDDPLYGYIDKNGEYAIHPQFSSASSFKENKARVGSCTVYL